MLVVAQAAVPISYNDCMVSTGVRIAFLGGCDDIRIRLAAGDVITPSQLIRSPVTTCLRLIGGR